MRSLLRHLLLAVALSSGLTSSASAQAVTLRISDPVPAELRGRVSELLKSQRPHDTDGAIAAAKIEDGGLLHGYGILLLRVETGCRRELCMVIVGRVTERVIIPELILGAGPRVYAGDEVEVIWGAAGPPLMFEGHDRSAILAFWSEHGWVIESCSACFPEIEEHHKRFESILPPVDRAPPAIVREETFDGFTRALGALR